MSQTLSEIVNSALRQADASIKVASLRDAPIEDRGFARVDDYLAHELGQREAETQKYASAAPQQEQYFTGFDDIEFAFKLAEALEEGADVVAKLAGPLSNGNVPLQPQTYDHASTVSPAPQASSRARAVEAHNSRLNADGTIETDEDFQLNEGPVIPNNYPTSKVPTTGAMSKKANLDRAMTQRILRSKIAQHKMLVSLGQIDAANAVLKEASELAGSDNSDLVYKTDNYAGANFPDNEGVRNLTKAQARDRNQREAASFYGEPVKHDNAATAHLAVTDGLKLSQVPISALYKQATTPAIGGGVMNRVKSLFTGSELNKLKDVATPVAGSTGLAKSIQEDAAKRLLGERAKVWGTRGGAGLAGAAGIYGVARDKNSADAGWLRRGAKRTGELFSGSRLRELKGAAKPVEGASRLGKSVQEDAAKRLTGERAAVWGTRGGAAVGVGGAGYGVHRSRKRKGNRR